MRDPPVPVAGPKAAGAASLPVSPRTEGIPRLIHQTFPSAKALLPELQTNIADIKSLNPNYDHKLYDDEHIVEYIKEHYGREILASFLSISPVYGAARADLFRYLLLYREGGVYLDIKSTTTEPLDDHLKPDDQYILAQWDNGPGLEHENWGLGYKALPGGEYQQWQIIAAPGHPFLQAVILRVLANLRAYRPWRHEAGTLGVLSTTGPWAYTDAIAPIRALHPHRFVASERAVGLRYSIYERVGEHRKLAKTYYRWNTAPVVRPRGPLSLAFDAYHLQKRVRDRLKA